MFYIVHTRQPITHDIIFQVTRTPGKQPSLIRSQQEQVHVGVVQPAQNTPQYSRLVKDVAPEIVRIILFSATCLIWETFSEVDTLSVN